MVHTTLSCGMHQAAEGQLAVDDQNLTVGQHIEYLLQGADEGPKTKQIQTLLQDSQAIIEVRSGDIVQTARPDMPLRELVPSTGDKVEITVSEPHVGG